MKKIRLLSCLVLLVVCAAAPMASAQYQPWDGAKVIDDPEWRKRFLGGYGFLSGAEPEIRADELTMLREVVELMRVNPRAAATMLEGQLGPDSSASLDFVLANLQFQNGELDAAVERYRAALEKFPDFRRAHKNLGLLMVQQGDFSAALVHLSRAVELGDRDGRNYGLIGYGYINLGNHLAAEVAYSNAILQDPDTRDWKLGLARSLLAMNRYREAISLFESLIGEQPDDPTLWLLQANAYIGLDEPMEAAVNLETVRMMGKAPNSSLVLLGDIYMNAGMSEFARSAYVEVIESDQGASEFETAYRAAELLVRAGSHAEAEKVIDSMERRYEQLAEADELRVLTLKGKVARAQGKQEVAARLLESIVERDGTRGDALLELAAYYDGKGDRESALMLIERAQKLDEFEYAALLAHAQLRVSAKEYAEAATLLRRAIQIKREPRVERYLVVVDQAIRAR